MYLVTLHDRGIVLAEAKCEFWVWALRTTIAFKSIAIHGQRAYVVNLDRSDYDTNGLTENERNDLEDAGVFQ